MIRKNTTVLGAALLAAALLAAPSGAAAQGARLPTDHPLTLRECVTWALEGGPEYQSATQGAAGATEAAAEAKASYWPSLSFSTSYSRWQRRIFLPNGLGFPGMELPTLVGPTNDGAWSFTSSYTLFDGGERKARLKSAQAQAGAAEASREEVRQTVALNVESSFFAFASAQEGLRVAEDGLKRAQDHLRIATDRKAVGAVPLLDVLRAQVAVSDAKVTLVGAKGTLRTARGDLATAMGLPAETPLDIAPLSGEAEAPDAQGLIPALNAASAERAAVKAAQSAVEAARRGVDAAKSTWAPKVVAFGSWGREDAAWLPQDKTWSAGVALSFPIFTGFSRVHAVAKAKTELAKAQADRDQVLLTARRQGWEAFSAYQEAYERVQACTDLVAQARESHRFAKERYEVGAGTLTDLLDSETSLANAEATEVRAKWRCRSARARYLWSVGRLLEQ